MKLIAFSVFDLKAETYFPPFYMNNNKTAERVFGDSANNNEHMFNKHPSDYALYALGTFDDEKGVFVNYDKHEHLGLAAEYIQQN
jgi:hypothetical protein